MLLELSPAAFEGLLARDDLQLTELLARIGTRPSGVLSKGLVSSLQIRTIATQCSEGSAGHARVRETHRRASKGHVSRDHFRNPTEFSTAARLSGARRVVATTDDGGRLRATTLRDALACELADSDAITCAVACCTQYWIARSACDQVELELLRRAPAPPVRLALSIEVKQPIINGKSQPPFFSITAELAPT